MIIEQNDNDNNKYIDNNNKNNKKNINELMFNIQTKLSLLSQIE